VAFSVPVACVAPALLVRAGNPLGLRDTTDLAAAHVRVAVVKGSYEEARARRLGLPAVQVLAVPDARTGYGAVVAGGADAFWLTGPAIRWLADSVADSGTVEAVALPAAPVARGGPDRPCTALAVRREDRTLREAIDRELRRFVGSPEHLELVRGFGFAVADLPVARERAERGAERGAERAR
jgi:polar amino acid transport system substrate-binding protein